MRKVVFIKINLLQCCEPVEMTVQCMYSTRMGGMPGWFSCQYATLRNVLLFFFFKIQPWSSMVCVDQQRNIILGLICRTSSWDCLFIGLIDWAICFSRGEGGGGEGVEEGRGGGINQESQPASSSNIILLIPYPLPLSTQQLIDYTKIANSCPPII